VVKLTDFGIGQVVSQEALAGITRAGFTQTMLSPGSSAPFGTQLYVAPELMAGQPASPRSDIYSLGVVLYQFLVGDFARPLTTDWARRISDPLLREDLDKCFAGDPIERFANAGELAAQLRALERRHSEITQRKAALVAHETTERRRRWLWKATIGCSAVLVMAAILVYAFERSRLAILASNSIVVLPLKNDSLDKADEYLSDSLTGEFFNRLKKVPGLIPKRIPKSMAADPIDDIRMTLLAKYNDPTIFEGSVKKTGARLHMTATLVNAVDGKKLWSEHYDRDSKGVLTLPVDLVRAVTRTLKLPLTAVEAKQINTTPTQNPEAYDAYLQGKFYSPFEDPAKNVPAIEMLERAVHQDTNFALAFAELGRAYVARLSNLNPSETDLELKAKTTIAAALVLNPSLAEAHFSKAYLLWSPSQHFQHEPAVEELRTALRLDPQSEEADWWITVVYHHIGLLTEAKRHANLAMELNPLDPRGYWTKGIAFAFNGEYSAALNTWASAPGEHWTPAFGDWLKAWAHIQLGQTNDARIIIDNLLGNRPSDYGGLFASLRAMLYAKAGETDKAEREIAKAVQQKERFVHFHHTAYQIASAYALMNQPNKAVAWFKESVNDGWNCYPLFIVDENLAPLKEIPEFKRLLAEEKKRHEYFEGKFGGESTAWKRLQWRK
jgi:TolB-like protein/Tfp pilus assembly protein PilF